LITEIARKWTSLVASLAWFNQALSKLPLPSSRTCVFAAVEVLLYWTWQIFTNNSCLV